MQVISPPPLLHSQDAATTVICSDVSCDDGTVGPAALDISGLTEVFSIGNPPDLEPGVAQKKIRKSPVRFTCPCGSEEGGGEKK